MPMTTAALLKQLDKRLQEPDGDTAELAWALQKEGAVEAVEHVERHLASRLANVRASAAMTLGQMGEMAAPAVRAIAKLIHDKNEDVRCSVVSALGMIGPKAAGGIPALVAGLRDTSDEVRRQAALSLGDVGAQDALPALCAMYRSEKRWDARWNIITAIVALGGDTPTLELALQDEDEEVRKEAARGLKAIRKKTARSGSPLLAMIETNTAQIAETLAAFGDEDSLDEDAAASVASLRAQNIDAALTLARLGVHGEVATRILEEALARGDADDDEEISDALTALGVKRATRKPAPTKQAPKKKARTSSRSKR